MYEPLLLHSELQHIHWAFLRLEFGVQTTNKWIQSSIMTSKPWIQSLHGIKQKYAALKGHACKNLSRTDHWHGLIYICSSAAEQFGKEAVFKIIVWHFGNYAYFPSIRDWEKKVVSSHASPLNIKLKTGINWQKLSCIGENTQQTCLCGHRVGICGLTMGQCKPTLIPHFLGPLHKFSLCKSTMGCPQKTHAGPM